MMKNISAPFWLPGGPNNIALKQKTNQALFRQLWQHAIYNNHTSKTTTKEYSG